MRDVVAAFRSLRRYSTVTLVVVLTLGAGIGGATAIFGVINAAFLTQLPVSRAQELVQVIEGGSELFPNNLWEELQHVPDVFSGIFAWSPTRLNTALGGEARYVRAAMVSGDFFDVLGIAAANGRVLERHDDRRGAPPVVVLSHHFWNMRYAGAREVVGNRLSLNGTPFEVVGIAAEGFEGIEVGESVDVFVPLSSEPQLHFGRPLMDCAYCYWMQVVGRLADGVSREQATARLRAAAPAIFEATVPRQSPPAFQDEYRRRQLLVVDASNGLSRFRERFRQTLFLLLGTVVAALLVMCANAAGLLLLRGNARMHEFALRLALGASRQRLLQQLLTESLLLTSLAALLGAASAPFLGRALLVLLVSQSQGIALNLTLNWRALMFATAAALASGTLVGIWPAISASQTHLDLALRAGARGGTERSSLRVGRSLIIAEIVLSFVLISGAGVFLRSLQQMRAGVGFDPEGVLLVRIETPANPATNTIRPDWEALRDRFGRLPGVTNASRARMLPASGSSYQTDVEVQGGIAHIYRNYVSPGFFETLRIPVRSGRDVKGYDQSKSPRVAVINETMAQRLFPGRNPIGQVFREQAPAGAAGGELTTEVVGVVADAKYARLQEAAPPTAFQPILQDPGLGLLESPGIYLLRFAGPVADIRTRVLSAVREVAPHTSVDFQLFSNVVRESLIQESMLAALTSLFAIFATILAGLGVYAATAYEVARHRKGIAIRLALGSTPSRLIRNKLGEAGVLLLVAAPLATIGILACSRLVRAVHDIDVAEVSKIAVAAGLLLALIVLLAAYLPVRQAAELDPAATLREY